jgi:hypothetical protein
MTWLSSLFLLSAALSQNAVQPCGFVGDQLSRTFTLKANGLEVGVVETPAMTAAERQKLCDAYQKLPSYCHIDDPACMHLHVAQLMAQGDVDMEICADEEIKEFRVHPLAWNIKARSRGHRLSFQARQKHQPGYYIVRINQLPPLMIALDLPEAPVVDNTTIIDAAAFLTDRTGAIEQTDNLHRAFAAANGSGKTVHIPPGIYLVDQLHIRDGHDFNIHLAPGCLLKARYSTQGDNAHRHGLWLENCRNMAVMGRGAIDHQAYEHYALSGNNYQHGMVDYYTSNDLCPWISQSPLFMTGCKNVLIEGITIRNGRNFNVNARNCDSLILRSIKIFTPPACTPEYGDGINTSSCRHVVVENCFVACNDDCFASGHYFTTFDNRSSQDQVVTGMLGWNMRANAVRLGFYSSYDQGDFTFQDCHFVAMPFGGVLIHALRTRNDGRPGRYGKICVKNCSFDDGPRLRSLFKIEKAVIQELVLENLTYSGQTLPSSRLVLEGDPTQPISALVLDHVNVNGHDIRTVDESILQIRNVAHVSIK